MSAPIIGCVQLNSQQDIDANLKTVTDAIAKASNLGASMVVLPENMLSMGNQSLLAERFDALSAALARLALHHNIYIVAGTLPCPYRPDGTPVVKGLLRQVSQLFDPSGKRLARYDKIHLFKAQVGDNKGSYDEGRTFEAGDKLIVAQCEFESVGDIVNIGMMVCFDLRFPALAQRLRSFDADILTAPSAFTYLTGQAHWQLLLQARALDSQCMIIGSPQGGIHHYTDADNSHNSQIKQTRRTWGHAMITNANGNVVIEYPSDTTIGQDKAINKESMSELGKAAPKTSHSHISTTTNKFDTSNTTINEDGLGIYIGSNYALLTTKYDHKQQQQWRQDLPIARCHRLG